MTLLSPKAQSRDRNKEIENNYLCPSPSDFDLAESPNSLTSLSSADFVAGGTLDPYTTTKIQRSSTFTSSNQYITDDSDIHSRKKLFKIRQFFDNYQDSITTLEIEVADKQQELEKFDTLLKIKNETEEALKEQIWNLELKNQDLQQQMNQLQSSSTKSLAEQIRLERENEILGQDLENLKMTQQTNETEMKKMQQDNDREILLLKRALTQLKQEKVTLNKLLESRADTKQANLFQNNNSNIQANSKEQEVTEMNLESKDVKSSEVESKTLRVSLENAHILIGALQNQIQDEIIKRNEVDQLLREAQETIETFQSSSLAIQSPQQTHHQIEQEESRTPEDYSDSISESRHKGQHNIGQSLGDELYYFFNSTTFEKYKNDSVIEDHETPSDIQNQSDLNEQICQPQTNSQDTDQPQEEEFGSLIKEPESFIYKPIENHKYDTIASENNTVESNQNALSQATSFQNIGTNKSHLAAIAITMTGNWMWKYKRKVIGSSISSNKHRRFVWIHPYSRTLYWSVVEPGSKGTEYKTKSATIESYVVVDNKQAELPSILIKTALRWIKIQCLNMNYHTIWINSLRYLLMEEGSIIDKATSEWLNNIIRPALGKRGLDTKVRRLLDTPYQTENHRT